MNVVDRNQLYLKGIMRGEGLFPYLEVAPAGGFFNWDFGLAELPREPGIIVIRGPRRARGRYRITDELYLVDKPSHATSLVGKSHRRGKGCVVGMVRT
jgi:hypothetical protein